MIKIKKILKIGIETTFASSLLYFGSMVVLSGIAEMRAEPFHNRKQLEEMLEVEKKKLGIENKDIDVVVCYTNEDYKQFGRPSGSLAFSGKKTDNTYLVVLGPQANNTYGLKHELYHIADGHCDAEQKPFPLDELCYFFYYEPQAVVYSATDWKW